jgi:hypothetical protein
VAEHDAAGTGGAAAAAITRSAADTSLRPTLLAVYAGLGATASIFGASLSALASRLGSDVATLSLVTPAVFCGLLLGIGGSAVATRRCPPEATLVMTSACQGVALALVPWAPTSVLVMALAVAAGAGFGASEVAATVVAARHPRAAAHIAGLTAVFAAAAIVTPLLVSAGLRATGTLTIAFTVAATMHLVAAWSGRRAPPPIDVATPMRASQARQPSLLPIALILAAYVGAEATLGTWSAALGQRLLGLSTASAAFTTTGFWVSVLIGRVVGAWLLRRAAPQRVLRGTLLTGATAAGGAAVLFDWNGVATLILLAVTAASMGPIYALTLSVVAAPIAPSPMKRTSMLIALGAVGGVVVPALAAPAARYEPASVVLVTGVFLAVAAAVALGQRCRD